MTKNYELKAKTRDRFGKNEMHRLRNEGRVPAVVYGPKDDSLAISLDSSTSRSKTQLSSSISQVKSGKAFRRSFGTFRSILTGNRFSISIFTRWPRTAR